MAKSSNNKLTAEQQKELIAVLKKRFEKNSKRHKNMNWQAIENKLIANPTKLYSLYLLEQTGGEPDVIEYNKKTDEYIYYDCCIESPKERRSFCYDRAALDSRKEFKPSNTVIDMANEMGVELLDEAQYKFLQQYGPFDLKTSTWLKTPDNIRKLGGAIFGDFRYDHVFIYHNGASSYYAARGFRARLII